MSILAAFVVPFVKDSLRGSQECSNVLGTARIDESIYNCNIDSLNIDSTNTLGNRTGFSVRVGGDEIVGLKFAFFSSGDSSIVEILGDGNYYGGELSPRIRMLSEQFWSEGDTDPNKKPLVIPNNGGVRTYVADGLFDKIELSATLKSGKVCDLADSININPCIDSDAIEAIKAY